MVAEDQCEWTIDIFMSERHPAILCTIRSIANICLLVNCLFTGRDVFRIGRALSQGASGHNGQVEDDQKENRGDIKLYNNVHSLPGWVDPVDASECDEEGGQLHDR